MNIFIFAGEKSGDLHGSNLIKALKQNNPTLEVEGVGGPEMRGQEMKCVLNMEDFEVMGFTDVIKVLPRLVRQFVLVREHILKTQPKVVTLIDYTTFSLRLARSLRKRGFKGKIVQYISPSFWAWGEHRIQQMAQNFDLLLTIYPFEAEHVASKGLAVEYVGNPVLENIQKHPYHNNWKQLLGIKSSELVAIFPGSRKGEIERNLPDHLEAARLLKKKYPNAVFGISCAHAEVIPFMYKVLHQNSLKFNKDIFLIPKGYTYELMRDCRTAMAKAGTVTLELALHEKPTVVTYRLSFLNRLYAKYILRLNLPHYCIANILTGKEIFPELIAEGLNPKNLFSKLAAFHEEGEERNTCIADCQKLKPLLQEFETSHRAAQAIENLYGEVENERNL